MNLKETYTSLGLSDYEYDRILELLGRAPNYLELSLFSVMWSEHCGYKHSRPLLALLPFAACEDIEAGLDAPAPTEQAEALEQLRALWHGYRIAVLEWPDAPPAGVDTPDDLERVRRHYSK